MSSRDSLKKDLKMMHDLENLTNMLEQSAARTIAQMRTDILNSRAYFTEAWQVYGILKHLAPPTPEVVHKHLVVGIGIDWGMPGPLLNRVMDKVASIQQSSETDLLVAGKMSHGRFRGNSDHTVHLFSAPKKATLAAISPIYEVISKYAHATIVYPSFESLSRQNILTASLSIGSLAKTRSESKKIKTARNQQIDPSRFIVDPNLQEVSNYMNQVIVGLTVHHYFSESILAYSAAQMVAMRNGHENSKQEGNRLLIRYHKARREEIDAKIRELHGSRASHSVARTEEEL